MKKLLSVLISTSLICLLAGCGNTETSSTTATNNTSDITTEEPAETQQIDSDPAVLDDQSGYTDMVNYTVPKDGEDIVELKIKDKGTVRIKLFPELLPKACENFTTLVSQGYYDGLTFHRVISDFMIQGGDPEGTGRGGRCIWGERFDGGYSKYLYHVKGALAYANSGSTATDGSQFYIVVGTKTDKNTIIANNEYTNNNFKYTDKAYEAYAEDGGTAWLDGSYTVFGQVFEGMDIVTEICNNTQTDANDKPVESVIIEKASIVKYEEPKGNSEDNSVQEETAAAEGENAAEEENTPEENTAEGENAPEENAAEENIEADQAEE